MQDLDDLTDEQQDDYWRQLHRGASMRTGGYFADLNWQGLSSFDGMVIDGQITGHRKPDDTAGTVGLGLTIDLYDETHELRVADEWVWTRRLIFVTFGVQLSDLSWADVTVFAGRVTKARREGPVVHVEAAGMGAMGDHGIEGPVTFRKGMRKVDVVHRVLTDHVGQPADTIHLPNLNERLRRDVTIHYRINLRRFATDVMASMEHELFWRPTGDVIAPPFDRNPVYRFTDSPVDGMLLSKVAVGIQDDQLGKTIFNAVRYIGVWPHAPKGGAGSGTNWILAPISDTSTEAYDPTNTHGSDVHAPLESTAGGPGHGANYYMRAPGPGYLPDGALIEDSHLKVYTAGAWGASPITLVCQAVTSTWDPDVLKWPNNPTLAPAQVQITKVSNTEGDEWDFDVTGLMRAHRDDFHGLAIRRLDGGAIVNIYTADATVHNPRLNLNWKPKGSPGRGPGPVGIAIADDTNPLNPYAMGPGGAPDFLWLTVNNEHVHTQATADRLAKVILARHLLVAYVVAFNCRRIPLFEQGDRIAWSAGDGSGITAMDDFSWGLKGGSSMQIGWSRRHTAFMIRQYGAGNSA